MTKKAKPCPICGGPKSPVRGARYCDECKVARSTALVQHEHERSRRRSAERFTENLAAGKRVARHTAGAPEGYKWCARCQAFRRCGQFTQHIAKLSAYCKPCTRAYNRERLLLLKFGITWEEYDALLVAQDSRCAICLGKPSSYNLAVDHDHKTGELRGLLCSRCNHRLLGSANDSASRLRHAADYLERFAPRDILGRRHLVPGFGGLA